ncbi:MAG: hypothetical protein ACI9QV_000082 [Methylophagaceae bacterium]|jgi:hypothetical protein
MGNIRSLPLFYQDKPIGVLSHEKEAYCFKYYHASIQTGFAISRHIPFTGDASSGAVMNFLMNLFPEGGAFDNKGTLLFCLVSS